MKLINILAILLISASCNPEKSKEEYFQSFMTHFPYLSQNTWKVYFSYAESFDSYVKVEATRTEADTIYVVELIKSIDPQDSIKTIYKMEIVKSYSVNGDHNLIYYDENGLFKYHYIVPKNGNDFLFVEGKYYYNFLNDILSQEQIDYFLSHKDSLIRIKGNDLPPLPTK